MKVLKRKPPAERAATNYTSSVVDLVRNSALASAGSQLPYTVSRPPKSLRKVVSLILRTTLRMCLGAMIAGVVIGSGQRLFNVLNNGAHVSEYTSSMYAIGSSLFVNAAMGATLGAAVGLAGGLIVSAALVLVRQDLSDERAS